MLQAIIDRINKITGFNYKLVKLAGGVLDLESIGQKMRYNKNFPELDEMVEVKDRLSLCLWCEDRLLYELCGRITMYLTGEEEMALIKILKDSKDNDNGQQQEVQ